MADGLSHPEAKIHVARCKCMLSVTAALEGAFKTFMIIYSVLNEQLFSETGTVMNR